VLAAGRTAQPARPIDDDGLVAKSRGVINHIGFGLMAAAFAPELAAPVERLAERYRRASSSRRFRFIISQ